VPLVNSRVLVTDKSLFEKLTLQSVDFVFCEKDKISENLKDIDIVVSDFEGVELSELGETALINLNIEIENNPKFWDTVKDIEHLNFAIEKTVNILNEKNKQNLTYVKKSALNPFSDEIRNQKTIYYISDNKDIVDLCSYLISYYRHFNTDFSLKFKKILEFLYTILKNRHNITIIIENGFNELYVNFSILEDINFEELNYDSMSVIGDDLILKDSFIYLRVNPDENGSVNAPKEINYSLKSGIDIKPYDKKILRQSHINKISAVDFVSDLSPKIILKVNTLEQLENSLLEAIFDYEKLPKVQQVIKVSTIFLDYSNIINSMQSFMPLSYSLASLGAFLRSIDIDGIDLEINKKFIIYLKSIASDLKDWRINIFKEKSSEDIHYLDNSLLSSCIQLESLLTKKVIEDLEENDLELF
jgi:two-component system chemotaxis response regulator CheY